MNKGGNGSANASGIGCSNASGNGSPANASGNGSPANASVNGSPANASAYEKCKERYKELKKLIGVQESRVQNLQSNAFQLANYYFVFQGVVLAATSNSSSLSCARSWFIFALSSLAAVLNLFALFSIACKYVRAMTLHEQTWSEYNETATALSLGETSLYFTGDHYFPTPGNSSGHPWIDRCSQRRRYAVLVICIILFLAFTVVTLLMADPWGVCKHDHHHHRPHAYSGCLKLCDQSSSCIFFCQDM